MKRTCHISLLLCVTAVVVGATGVAAAAGLLKAQSFPKTANDASFIDRMKNLAEGYEPFETEFDENGRCISGCPYHGFTVENQIEQIKRAEEISRLLRQEDNIPVAEPEQQQEPQQEQEPETKPESEQKPQPEQNPEPSLAPEHNPQQEQNPETKPERQPQQAPNPNPQSEQRMPQKDEARSCPVFLEENKPHTKGPKGEPLKGCPRISSKYGFRTHPVTGEPRKMHHAVDMPIPSGTNVYATGDGVVIKAENNENRDPCGKYVKIQHPNGMISLYCHLSEILVHEKENIQSGCLIAKSGNTGRTTGAHLHYGLRLSNGNSVDPEKWMLCKHKH